MDLIRKILSHFQTNKANKKAITINGITIQQINNNVQQNNDTAESNKEEHIEIEVPPPKKLKKDVIEVKSGEVQEDSNISEAKASFNEEETAISVNNNYFFTVIDLTDNVEVGNVLEIGKTAENNNISEAGVSTDNQTAVSVINNDNNMIIDLTENHNSHEVQNMSKISQTAETIQIIKAKVTADKDIATVVKNENITPENDTNKDPTSNDIIPSDGQQTAVSLNNNINKVTNINEACNPSRNNLQNILKTGETTENSNITEDNYTMSINNNSSIAISDNTDNPNCNKINTSKNEPKLVTDILIENAELVLINDNTEETTTECIREFEDIFANVENKLTLDPEMNLDDVNDLINDFKFDSDDEFQMLDTESQIPQHIIRKDVEKQIPTDVIDFSYDTTVESVDLNKPIELPDKINSNTERDTKIKTATNTGNTVKDNNKPDINTNNSNTNTNTEKTEDFDTISLSSDDNTNIKDPIYISDSSDSDCGYHSSDFEFITEDEAKLEGLIINSPAYLKRKAFNAKTNCRQSKIRKITSKGKTVQAGPSTTNGKNAQVGPSKTLGNTVQPGYPGTASKVQIGPSSPVQMPLNIHSEPINTVQGPSYVQAGPRNPFKRPSNIQAGPSNPVRRPSNVQARRRNPDQYPSNIQAQPSNPIQRPLNMQAEPSNLVQNPSNMQAGPSNPVQIPSNMQAKPSNPVQNRSNMQAGQSNPVQSSLNMQAGPSPVQYPSNIQAGPSSPVQNSSNMHAGPSNAVQNPSNIQAGPSNPVQSPSNMQAGPSNTVRPSNVQPIPNYEMYRNKYKKPFQYDTAYKNNHIEPQEDGYLDLFRGFHAGVYPMYTRENKSVTPHFSNPERIWYQGVGFDMQMMGNSSDEEDNEFKDEANATIQKITSEFSMENRRRRFREK